MNQWNLTTNGKKKILQDGSTIGTAPEEVRSEQSKIAF